MSLLLHAATYAFVAAYAALLLLHIRCYLSPPRFFVTLIDATLSLLTHTPPLIRWFSLRFFFRCRYADAAANIV